MSDLVKSLLAYARVGSGAVRLVACDCESVLSGVTQSLAASLEAGGATVTHDALPTVQADPVLISELMQNLIENAVKYRSDHPPHVHVSATEADSEIIISVRDNGIGLPEQMSRPCLIPSRSLSKRVPLA